MLPPVSCSALIRLSLLCCLCSTTPATSASPAAPALFDLALASEGWHAAQHLSFLISALLFWTAMLGRRRDRRAGERGLAALCLFVTSLISGALGALMAFSQSPWYQGLCEKAI